jgi:hypothetical protein
VQVSEFPNHHDPFDDENVQPGSADE